jgi:hypothetical protein
MSAMRWEVGWVATVVLALGCSSPLAPLRSNGGNDAAVDHGLRPIGPTPVVLVIDAASDFVSRPHASLGMACQSGADCLSDYCVDGVCCNIACSGPCVTCSTTGKVGTCFPVDVGAPSLVGGCPAESPATCGMTGMCDGVGGCQLYPGGTLCGAGTCLDGTTAQGASICDGLGSCRPGPTRSCAPYTCANGLCKPDDCQQNPADCLSTGNRDASSD